MTNFVTNAGSGGSTFASDTIAAVEYPLAKSAWGAAGAVNQTSAAAPMPVTILTAPTATTGAITTSSTTIGPVTMGSFDGLTVAVSGTYAGVNFGFWGSNDNTIWYPVAASRTDIAIAETTTGVLTANTTRAWDVSIGEALYFRIVSTAWTSGSAAINIMPGMMAAEPVVAAIAQGPAASGSALVGNPVLVAGSDATNARTMLVDTSGRVIVTGAAASAATIAGNPVLMGLTFTTTPPTVTTGQAVNAQSTNRGEQLVALSNGATQVAVKAASTAAATADPALVVSMAGANSATKIGDGTNNAVITAASTATVAASAALAVSLSPNSGLAPTTNALHACSTGIAAALTVANIKASAGSVYGMSIANLTASTVYIQFYNTAGTPTLGTSVVWFVAVPASGTLTIPASAIALANFATGIGIGASTTATSTGTPATAPAVTIFYK